MAPKLCYFCAIARNCATYLDAVFENIQKLGSLFIEYKIVFFYEKSIDDTLAKLLALQSKYFNIIHLHINEEPSLAYNTWNLARARNFCLNFIRTKSPDCPFYAMFDINSVTCKPVRSIILKKYLQDPRWDALSFKTNPIYYDVWALSIFPYSFSVYHFKNHTQNTKELRAYITDLLNKTPNNQLLPCISAFNGFCIYRMKAFDTCEYSGKLDLSKIPNDFILSHGNKAKSEIVYEKIKNFSGRHEDCEHRSFHIDAHLKNKANIMISPHILFVDYEPYLSLFDIT